MRKKLVPHVICALSHAASHHGFVAFLCPVRPTALATSATAPFGRKWAVAQQAMASPALIEASIRARQAERAAQPRPTPAKPQEEASIEASGNSSDKNDLCGSFTDKCAGGENAPRSTFPPLILFPVLLRPPPSSPPSSPYQRSRSLRSLR